MKRLLVILSFVLVAVMVFPTTVMAGGVLDGRVVVGGSFTLEQGETLDGDLLVMGGNVTLEVESRVAGDVVVLGGNVSSNGTIDGSVTIVGGNVRLKSNALVRGDVRTVGGSLSRSEGSRIEGQFFSESDFRIPFDFDNFDWSGPVIRPIRFTGPSLLASAFWYMFRIFMLAGLALLSVMFWPKPTERVAQSIIDQPLIAGGVGLLTVLVLPILLLFLVITILLIPVALLVICVSVIAILFGWVAIGLEVGKRLGEMLKWELHPAAEAGIGTFLFSAVVLGVGEIPCIGWIAPFAIGLLAFGGIILSRFGRMTYRFQSTSTAVVEAPEPVEDKPKKRTRKTTKEE